jgi:hypothetical protein
MPKIVVLDSSTIGRVSKDYWSTEKSDRDKAHVFLERMKELGIFIAFTWTHVSEIIRHGNVQVVRDRRKFLHNLPLIAWVRPYSNHWFPGSFVDVLLRELHAVVYGSAGTFTEIVEEVRPKLWETGVGSEMFVDSDNFWSEIRFHSEFARERDKYVASVARTDPGQMKNIRLADVSKLPFRPKEEREAYAGQFMREIQEQIDQHGDKCFGYAREAAFDLANDALLRTQCYVKNDEESHRELLKSLGVPPEFVSPEMTISEIGALGVYAKKLSILASNLYPSIDLTMKEVPPDTLPSIVLDRELTEIQRKALRVSGSDLGDSSIVPLVLYSDGVEVDKRTYEFLSQIKYDGLSHDTIMRKFFRSSDYSQIPERFER